MNDLLHPNTPTHLLKFLTILVLEKLVTKLIYTYQIYYIQLYCVRLVQSNFVLIINILLFLNGISYIKILTKKELGISFLHLYILIFYHKYQGERPFIPIWNIIKPINNCIFYLNLIKYTEMSEFNEILYRLTPYRYSWLGKTRESQTTNI